PPTALPLFPYTTLFRSEVLDGFNKIIIRFSEELQNLSYYIISNEKPERLHHYKAVLEELKLSIDKVEEQGVNGLVLKKILINIRSEEHTSELQSRENLV